MTQASRVIVCCTAIAFRHSAGDAQARLGSFLEGGKRKEVESCTRKCVPTCIRGGEGAGGLLEGAHQSSARHHAHDHSQSVFGV